MTQGITRVDVGGKALTNQLKEIISYRQLDMSAETYVVTHIKVHMLWADSITCTPSTQEDVCFVAGDFVEELRVCRRDGPSYAHAIEYVLPDFSTGA